MSASENSCARPGIRPRRRISDGRSCSPDIWEKRAEQFEHPVGLRWWRKVAGADWSHPEGPDSSVEGREHRPVVQVSWNDAAAYAAWAGKRLPSEAEWEFASRGGLEQKRYPWGDELTPDGKHLCNIWQGEFPDSDLAEDGYSSTAPVDAFPANGFGLYTITGNAWEWCADWFSPDYHLYGTRVNPVGPRRGKPGRCAADLISATHPIAIAIGIRRELQTRRTAPERISVSAAYGTFYKELVYEALLVKRYRTPASSGSVF